MSVAQAHHSCPPVTGRRIRRMAVRSANQPPPLRDYNLVAENRPLVEAVRREGAVWAEEELLAFGDELGGAPLDWGRLANEHPPVLRTHDRFGNRVDEI